MEMRDGCAGKIMSEQPTHYAALIMQDWKRLTPRIIFDNERCSGFMPVYRTLEELRLDYPEAAFIEVTPTGKEVKKK